MKKFFTTMFACILGVLIAGFLGFILLMVGLTSLAAFSSGSSYTTSKPTVFCLELNSSVVDRVHLSPYEELKVASRQATAPLSLEDIMTAIDRAKEDKHIEGIYLTTDGYASSYAISTEIRRKLQEFKATGKWVVAYADNYSQNQYYVASVADSIYVNPVGSLDLSGLALTSYFYKGLLDKVGVDMQVFRVGTFKSAVEPYIADKMSPANREQVDEFLGSMWESIADSIATARGISSADLNLFADEGIGFMRADSTLVERKLVTALRYANDMEQLMKDLTRCDEPDYPGIDDVASIASKAKKQDDVIAILYAVGEIGDDEDSDIYYPDVVADINDLIDDDAVKAVVFRVNSPGGSAFASEQIWEAVGRLKAKKPVVVSMGTYAASGGYYISCGASRIVAEPTTLTGSIGVFGLIPCINKLMTQTLGITSDEVKTNRFGNLSIVTPLTEAEGRMIQNSVEQTYALFLDRCAAGRRMPVDSIARIAEGRVWTGADAIELGLVDELGGLQTALDAAAKLADVKKYSIETYPAQKSFFEELLESFGSDNLEAKLAAELGINKQSLKLLQHITKQDPIQARMTDITVR